MKIRVDVIGGAETMNNAKATRFQPIAVHFPGARMPVEDKRFIGKGEVLPEGRYELDLANGGLEPDASNYNSPRWNFFKLVRVEAPASVASAAARPAARAM